MAHNWLVRSVSLFALCAACGGRTHTKSVPDDASVGDGGARSGIVANECAPNDGPALIVVLNVEAPTPTCGTNGRTIAAGQRQITFYLWGAALPQGPGEIVVQTGASAAATASVCTSKACVNATGGTLTFTSYSASASTASGSYAVNLTTGEKVNGTFVATQCHNQTQCG